MAEVTINPDAHPETQSVDGSTSHTTALGSGLDWADLVVAAGTGVSDSGLTLQAGLASDNVADKWRTINRGIALFYVDIPAGSIINSAVLSLYGLGKIDHYGRKPATNIYSANPASDIALVAADYAQVGSTPFCDTPIEYDDFDTAGWNNWILNAAGRAAIPVGGGVAKFSWRTTFDAEVVEPAWGGNGTFWALSYARAWTADYAGGLYAPKLVIIYTPAVAVAWKGDIHIDQLKYQHCERMPQFA